MRKPTFYDLLNYSIQQGKTQEEILTEASRIGLYTDTASKKTQQAVEDGLIKSSTTGQEQEFTLDEDPTEAQAKSYKFAERMNVVNAGVEEAEEYIQSQTGLKSAGFALDVAQTRGDIPFVPGSITNQMADPKVRKAIQAQDAWMEANLRDTSGATIKEEEYEMNRPTYFAQPGDSEEILKSKKKLRETAMISTYEASGATKQQAQSLVNGEVPPEAPEVKEQSEDVRNKLDSMYEWAKNNPDDPAGKEFLTDWENDNIDFNTGELIQPRPETMTPSQRKAYEQNQAVQKAEAKKAQALETQQVQPQATNQEETKKQYNETLTAKTLDKIGDFTGMKKFGEGIGATTFLMTKEGRDLMDKAESGDKIAVDTMNSILEDAPNTKEVIGSALMTALNAVSGGIAGKAKATTTAGKLAVGGATGGAMGFAGGLEQDKDAKGIAKSTAVGTAVGTAVAGAGIGLDKYKANKLAGKSKKVKTAVGQILQGDRKDVQKGVNTLKRIDTKGAKTYQDLVSRVDDNMSVLGEAQNEVLSKDTTLRTLDKLDDVVTVGGKKVKTNYVAQALDDMDDLYTKTNDATNAERIKQLTSKAKTEGLTVKEINDIAKEYSTKFAEKAYKVSGDPKMGVNAVKLENTRSGVKKTLRALLPDDTSKQIDRAFHENYTTKKSLEKVDKAVNALEQKVIKRGAIEKTTRAIGKGVRSIPILGKGLKGLIAGMIDSNVGNKSYNAVGLQDALAKNLKVIQSDKFADRIVQHLSAGGTFNQVFINDLVREMNDE